MPVQRLKELTGPGLVFVTTTVIDWLPVFASPRIAELVARQLAQTAGQKGVSIVGYVVMPSHVHKLIGLHDIQSLSTFVQAFKSLTARRVREIGLSEYGRELFRSGRFQLWKRRFDDVIITSEEQFRIKLNYVHENPVKAGLSENAVDWPFSSARSWLLDESGAVPIDKAFTWIPR